MSKIIDSQHVLKIENDGELIILIATLEELISFFFNEEGEDENVGCF